jgi:UDP-2,3-diacylglucosamine pyrophosphatase LpxH
MAISATSKSGAKARVRTLFLSDLHLGFRHARVRELDDFLQGIEAERIVLVGDIVDTLALARRAFWTAGHTQIVRVLLARQRAGTRLTYIPGNHDASLAVLADMLQGQFEVHREWVHRTVRGERLLVLHGDQFDAAVDCPAWLSRLGDALYGASVVLSHAANNLRRAFGKPYCPFAERIKLSIGASVRYIASFEQAAVRHARAHGYDGVVCGHIHRANLRRSDGILYCNTGDWVESCSALIETAQGELQLLRWPQSALPVCRPAVVLAARAA